MACEKTVTIAETVAGDYPLDDAVYDSGTGKIFGTSGAYVVKFNATTGAVEDSVNIVDAGIGAILPPMYITTLSGILYVTTWNDTVRNNTTPFVTQQGKGIFPLNPATMLWGTPLNVYDLLMPSATDWFNGAKAIGAAGNRLVMTYFGADNNVDTGIVTINPLNIAQRFSQIRVPTSIFDLLQFDTDGTYIYYTQQDDGRVGYVKFDDEFDDDTAIYDETIYTTYGAFYYPPTGLAYGFGPSDTIIRADDFTTNATTVIVIGETMHPVHARYRALDGRIYFACPEEDAILSWNPVSTARTWHTGFSNPTDVVFAGTKVWAVQKAQTGLREVVV